MQLRCHGLTWERWITGSGLVFLTLFNSATLVEGYDNYGTYLAVEVAVPIVVFFVVVTVVVLTVVCIRRQRILRGRTVIQRGAAPPQPVVSPKPGTSYPPSEVNPPAYWEGAQDGQPPYPIEEPPPYPDMLRGPVPTKPPMPPMLPQ
ncbi:hypothetical protein CSKR_202214 [Clonorchis sinensis]|uniref:Uncharacterized protein n=1 Tax=Clonorchis sinensis TaxID=79923 RepID=A0A8T1LWZ5_CLOSI|nr:hypothetical protein CSKR_202214 [Clonorchis sinensis]